MQQFFSLLSWRLFTAQHVSGVWQSCCVRGRAGRPEHENSTTVTTIRR